MFAIFKSEGRNRIKYVVLLLSLILFFVTPYVSFGLLGVLAIILISLAAYSKFLIGGFISALWVIFTFKFWLSINQHHVLVLLTQGIVFGGLFKYQFNLRKDLEDKTNYLKEEKEMFDKILETTIDGFFMLDEEGDFIKVNQAYQDVLGYSEEELLTMNVNDVSVLQNKEEVKRQLRKIINYGRDKFESWHQAKDGDIISFEITKTYLSDIKDGVFVCFARDITVRKEKEQELKLSEAKFRSYIENAPYAIFIVNDEGVYTEINPKACQLSGCSAAEIIGSKVGTVGEVVDGERAAELFAELKEKGRVRGEIVFQKDKETKFDAEMNAVKIKENKYIGFAEDITQRRQAERKIKAERDKLRKYFEMTQAIVMRLDQKKRIQEINSNGCKILGYGREELVGENWFEMFIRDEDKAEMEDIFTKAFENDEVVNGENVIITKSGVKRDILWHNNILKDEEGEITGALCLGVDVTEIKSLREELEYSRLQVKFFSNLSHELKTPLNLIFSAHQMLKFEEQNLPQEKREKFARYLDIISKNGNRLLRLVNNILDINKFEANDFTLDLGNYDIIKVVKEVVVSITEYIDQQQREFEFNSELDQKVLICDPFNIERVLLNLLSNAIKFTDKGDKIEVKIVDLEEKVRIIVKDTGIGIPENKQTLIFRRFGQVDKSFTRNNEGSGVGLAIVKLIVDAHGGEIQVESKPDEGSEFIVDLPDNKDLKESSYLEYESPQLTDRIDRELSDIYS
ncbi:MAG: PAS domain S-box protein [Halanaerobacter sp.]